ncbi:MAG: DUF4870 domain-containing protein [Terriglobales bacterium]|jgi:uncharacterized Tic20 family protein
MSEASTGRLQFNTTQDERTMGPVCGLLAAFTGFLGPLIIFVKKDSVFVRLCALQSLLWHVGYILLIFLAMFVFFVGMFTSIFLQAGHQGGGPPIFVLFFPFLWLFFIVSWILNLVLGILSGVKAGEGIWWPYPIAGRLAQKFLGVAV